MENKPKFCSECGAKLTGSAAFCPECGAKQQLAPAPAPAPAPEPAPAPAPAPEPAPAPAPAPVSADAPETSLAAPKKLGMSVPALIIAIMALMTAGLAFLLQFIAISRNYKFMIDFSLIGKYLRNRRYRAAHRDPGDHHQEKARGDHRPGADSRLLPVPGDGGLCIWQAAAGPGERAA